MDELMNYLKNLEPGPVEVTTHPEACPPRCGTTSVLIMAAWRESSSSDVWSRSSGTDLSRSS